MPNAVVSATSDGDNTIIAAVSGSVISVTSYVLTTIGSGGFTIKSNSTALSGAITPVAGTPIVAPMASSRDSYFNTAKGEALIFTNGSGVDVTGHITYRVEKV